MKNKKKPLISVVIPTWSDSAHLNKTLDSLAQQEFPKDQFEVVIVNDGMFSESVIKYVKEYSAKLQIIHCMQKHQGSASARNLGIDNSQGQIIAFTDDDCICHSDWLKEISNSLLDPTVIGVSGHTYSDIPPSFFIRNISPNDEKQTTANIALRRYVFDKVGYFDTNFQICVDGDMTWRIIDRIGSILRNPRMKIFHFPRYQSFLELLKKTKLLKYHVMLDAKFPNKRHLANFHYIFKGFLFKRLLYFMIWGFIPLPLPILVRLYLGLIPFWLKDFFELRKIKINLKSSKFSVKLHDQFLFIFFHWTIVILETFFLLKSIIQYKIFHKK